MAEENLSTTNNKKLMNWLLLSGLSLLIGISLILNIIYIPKYIQALKGNVINLTEITIDAVEGDPNNSPTEFFSAIEYDTNFATLGDLIKHYNNRYQYKSYLGLGDLLTDVSKKGDGTFADYPSNESWFIYRFDVQKHLWIQPDNGSSGMNLITLHNFEQYRLALHGFS